MEGLVGLLHDAIGRGLVDRQGVEGLAIAHLEPLFIGDGVEFVEAQAIVLAQVHGLLGNVFEDLAAGEVADVAGVVVAHQQLGGLAGHLVDAIDIDLGSGGGLHLVAPVGSEVVGHVLFQDGAAVELVVGNRPHHGMVLELADLLLHGGIEEIEVGHQAAITQLVDNSLEEAANETGVFSHRVGLFGPFTQLGCKRDRHGSGKLLGQENQGRRGCPGLANKVAKGYASAAANARGKP